MDDSLFKLIAADLKYIKDKVTSIENKMVTKGECLENMENCPIKTDVKKKSLT